MNILHSVMSLPLQRCDLCSFLRLKYAQFPAIILLVIFVIYCAFIVFINSKVIKIINTFNVELNNGQGFFFPTCMMRDDYRNFVFAPSIYKPSIIPSLSNAYYSYFSTLSVL